MNKKSDLSKEKFLEFYRQLMTVRRFEEKVDDFFRQGKVVGVQDGDSITVLHDGKGEKIRLYGVDCPEGGQDFGNRAKEFTSSLVFERDVEVKPVTTDRYGRTVAMVCVGNKCVSEELIRSGFGWVFTRYCTESFCDQWRKLEEQARKSKLRLWAGPNPIPPWEYRRYKK